MGVDIFTTFCYISYAVLGTHGGIAQLARAFGSYPECPRFKSRCRYQIRRSDPLRLLYGPLVKWLRHRPFTAVTWVRVPYGSPKQSSPPQGGLFCFAYHSRGTRTERCQKTCRGHVFPARRPARRRGVPYGSPRQKNTMRSPAAANGFRSTDGVLLPFQPRPTDAWLAPDLGLDL